MRLSPVPPLSLSSAVAYLIHTVVIGRLKKRAATQAKAYATRLAKAAGTWVSPTKKRKTRSEADETDSDDGNDDDDDGAGGSNASASLSPTPAAPRASTSAVSPSKVVADSLARLSTSTPLKQEHAGSAPYVTAGAALTPIAARLAAAAAAGPSGAFSAHGWGSLPGPASSVIGSSGEGSGGPAPLAIQPSAAAGPGTAPLGASSNPLLVGPPGAAPPASASFLLPVFTAHPSLGSGSEPGEEHKPFADADAVAVVQGAQPVLAAGHEPDAEDVKPEVERGLDDAEQAGTGGQDAAVAGEGASGSGCGTGTGERRSARRGARRDYSMYA